MLYLFVIFVSCFVVDKTNKNNTIMQLQPIKLFVLLFWRKGDDMDCSVCSSIRPSVTNTLAITLSFFKISLSNFRIKLLLTT